MPCLSACDVETEVCSAFGKRSFEHQTEKRAAASSVGQSAARNIVKLEEKSRVKHTNGHVTVGHGRF
jgi:hypothetical protein